MPTNYTGLKTNTQSPSPTPNPAVSPVLSLPVDGDPENAASIAQALKALADLEDWLTKPQAKSADWATPLMQFRSALGHTRALIDHLGLPGGRIIQWDEAWEASTVGSVSGTVSPAVPLLGSVPVVHDTTFASYLTNLASHLTDASTAADLAAVQVALGQAGSAVSLAVGRYLAGTMNSRWWMKGQQTSGIGYALPLFMAAVLRTRFLSVECGDNGGTDYTLVYRPANCLFDDNLSFALEWELDLAAANIPGRAVYVGFSDEGLAPPSGGSATNFAVFELDHAGNWLCSHGGSGGFVSVDSGVAGSIGLTRFRIEFHGATVADNGVRTLRYYINGVQKGGDITTLLPDATAGASAQIAVVNTNGGASGFSAPPGPIQVGPMRFRGSIYPADVI